MRKTFEKMNPRKFLSAANLLWPDFVVEGDCVFLRQERPSAKTHIDGLGDLLDQECFINHVHVLDRCEHDANLGTEPFWDINSEDFREAVELAAITAEIWASKLASEFPKESFAVFATRDDNPIVRFHKVRTDDAFWMEPSTLEQESPGAALFIHVQHGRIIRRIGKLKSYRMPSRPASI